MTTLLLNGVLVIFVLFESLKRKKYQYTVATVITALYFIFATLQSNYDLIANSQVFGWIQKIMLVMLAGYMIFTWSKSADKKANLPSVIFACGACVFRFLRTLVFNLYTANMRLPGADVQSIHQELLTYYVLVDSLTKFALVFMLCSIAWTLGKAKATES